MLSHRKLLVDHGRLTASCVQIKDAVGNEYGRPRDIAGESRVVFTSHADAAFDVCFDNILSGGTFLQDHTNTYQLIYPTHFPLKSSLTPSPHLTISFSLGSVLVEHNQKGKECRTLLSDHIG